MRNFVTVIIPAFNEEEYIGICLAALRDMGYGDNMYEIILVDNGSNDKTVEVAKAFGIGILIRFGGTIGALRNYGSKRAKGDFIAFVDGDCKVEKSWLASAMKHFDSAEVAAVGSRLNHVGSTWVSKCWSLMHDQKMANGEVEWVPSGNMIVRRKYFDQVRGFDEELITSEDYDLCLRLRSKGYKIISDPNVRSLHLNPPRALLEFYKKERWHGQEMIRIFLKRNESLSRALVYAIFCSFCGIGILLGAAASLILRNHWVLFLSGLAFVLGPSFLAIRTAYRGKKYRYVFPLVLMFMVYGIARAMVLIETVISRKWNRSKCPQE